MYRKNINEMVITQNELENIIHNSDSFTGNKNLHTHIYLVDNEIYKIYESNSYISKQNIDIVKKLLNNKEKYKIVDGLVLPNDLIICNDNIIGYSMPYVNGEALIDKYNHLTNEQLKEIYFKMIDTIEASDKVGINISDIHEKNIILDNKNNINIIDCDSFIIDGNELYYNEHIKFAGKYIERGMLSHLLSFNCHSKGTDYFCLLMTIINNICNDDLNRFQYLINFCNNKVLNKILERVRPLKSFYLTREEINYIVDNLEEINNYLNSNQDSIDCISNTLRRTRIK